MPTHWMYGDLGKMDSKMHQKYLVESLTGMNAVYREDKMWVVQMMWHLMLDMVYLRFLLFIQVGMSKKPLGIETHRSRIVCFWALPKNGWFSQDINQSQRIDKMSENRQRIHEKQAFFFT